MKKILYKSFHQTEKDQIEDIKVTIHDIQKIENDLNESMKKINLQLSELKSIKDKLETSDPDD